MSHGLPVHRPAQALWLPLAAGWIADTFRLYDPIRSPEQERFVANRAGAILGHALKAHEYGVTGARLEKGRSSEWN